MHLPSLGTNKICCTGLFFIIVKRSVPLHGAAISKLITGTICSHVQNVARANHIVSSCMCKMITAPAACRTSTCVCKCTHIFHKSSFPVGHGWTCSGKNRARVGKSTKTGFKCLWNFKYVWTRANISQLFVKCLNIKTLTCLFFKFVCKQPSKCLWNFNHVWKRSGVSQFFKCFNH